MQIILLQSGLSREKGGIIVMLGTLKPVLLFHARYAMSGLAAGCMSDAMLGRSL
jgi:hypothetical protein